jgi:putative nucleotidyltransferase with HDIG domain
MTDSPPQVLPANTTAPRLLVKPSRLSAYIMLVGAASLASLALPPTWTVSPSDWFPAIVVLTLISAALEFLTVPLPSGGTFSMATVSHVATVLLVPAPFAAISIGLSVLAEGIVRRVPLQKTVFNVGGMILTASLASFAMGLVGVVWHVRGAGATELTLLSPLVAVGLTYFLVNALLLGSVFSIVERRPLLSVLRNTERSTLLGEVATTAIGAQFALMWIIEPVLVVILAAPAFVIARSFDHVRRLTTETRDAVRSLAEIVDHRDATTYHHSSRVAANAARLARALELSDDDVGLIEQAAAVHDLGKIGVPDRVLLKPGPLTAPEEHLMHQHTELGSLILTRFELFRPGADIVRHHHERWDGAGYPDGLVGEAIPLGARIVAVVDAFDAMTSDRPYRAALSAEEAARRIAEGAGSQWDPRIAAAFLALEGADAVVPDTQVKLATGRPLSRRSSTVQRSMETDLEVAQR